MLTVSIILAGVAVAGGSVAALLRWRCEWFSTWPPACGMLALAAGIEAAGTGAYTGLWAVPGPVIKSLPGSGDLPGGPRAVLVPNLHGEATMYLWAGTAFAALTVVATVGLWLWPIWARRRNAHSVPVGGAIS
jgi:hypothetical protein